MCTQNCLTWVSDNLTKNEIKNKRIIEIGSYDVNGSVRPIIEALDPVEYIGIDMRQGPGVDIVCKAEDLSERFGNNSFDVVISICAFEHIKYWKESLANIKAICKPNGLIIFIVPANWPFHAYPNDFWRYDVEDITHIFSDCTLLNIETLIEENDNGNTLTYAKLQKPNGFVEINLSDYTLYSMITNTKIKHFYNRYFFTPYFIQLALIYYFNQSKIPLPIKKAIIYIIMGIKLKLLKPIQRLFS